MQYVSDVNHKFNGYYDSFVHSITELVDYIHILENEENYSQLEVLTNIISILYDILKNVAYLKNLEDCYNAANDKTNEAENLLLKLHSSFEPIHLSVKLYDFQKQTELITNKALHDKLIEISSNIIDLMEFCKRISQ